MKRNILTITPAIDPLVLSALAAEAAAEGHKMVAHLVEEWATGENRYDRPGEQLYVSVVDGQVCGVCGLNIDPFAHDNLVGRVRRLYISADFRRRGIGSTVMQRITKDAAGRFVELRLRTYDVSAAAFYEAIGFEPVEAVAHYTHRRTVVA